MKLATPGTVGRSCLITDQIDVSNLKSEYVFDKIHAYLGNFTNLCGTWPPPTVIISDGAYGILGFEGDTADPSQLKEWYEPYIKSWSSAATPQTTLWFWNSEIGWASVHPILEKYGWVYENANIWTKGKGHIAGNVNTATIRRFPVVTEICVQYSFKASINGMSLQNWLINEWKRSGLKLRDANTACGVKDAAVRKYLAYDHLWYLPPVEMFVKLSGYANEHGRKEGRPYFSKDGFKPITGDEWKLMKNKFRCPFGWTNVWERPAVRGIERWTINGKRAHLNQKPLDLMELIIKASSDAGDVIWEPFGGLFSASIAADRAERMVYGSEINPVYFGAAIKRIRTLKKNTQANLIND